MLSHLEYAIGVLCLGGVAAVAIHTLIETVGPNWRRILAVLRGGTTSTAEPISARDFTSYPPEPFFIPAAASLLTVAFRVAAPLLRLIVWVAGRARRAAGRGMVA